LASAELTGNQVRRENTKQARDQGMLEELQYRNREGIKEKRVRIVWELFEKADESDSYYGDIDPF